MPIPSMMAAIASFLALTLVVRWLSYRLIEFPPTDRWRRLLRLDAHGTA